MNRIIKFRAWEEKAKCMWNAKENYNESSNHENPERYAH